MNFDVITSDTFLIYATKNYNNPSCTTLDEFNSDLRLFMSIKRWLNKPPSRINIRVLTNQIIIVTNLFGTVAAPKLLFAYIDEKQHNKLKAVMDYLNFLPETLNEANLSNIKSCELILKKLKEL